MQNVGDVIAWGSQELKRADSDYAESPSYARMESALLLGYVLGVERGVLYAHPERPVTEEHLQRFRSLIERRAKSEPVAYLTGQKEFYGLNLFVNQHVLIPRPETELLVDAALIAIRTKLAAGEVPIVADIGTGSGAIPIALAVEEPRLPYLYGCDISAEALEVARINSRLQHVEDRVYLLQGDLLKPLPEQVDVLIANLPYVGTQEMDEMPPDVLLYEPHSALFSGPDGLALLRRFCKEAQQSGILKHNAVMLLEIGYQQRAELVNLLSALWPDAAMSWRQDYAGWDRVVQVHL